MATRAEREADPGSSFDGGYHLYAHEQYKKRVAKTPDRLEYAEEQLKKNDIEYIVKNASIGHIHCYSKKSDTLIQFWAGTGKIMNHSQRGIHNLIKLLLST